MKQLYKDKIVVLVNKINSECFYASYFDHDKMATFITECVESILTDKSSNLESELKIETKKSTGRPRKES